MLHIRSLEFIYLTTESLYPSTKVSHFTTPEPLATIILFSISIMFLDSVHNWNTYIRLSLFDLFHLALCCHGCHQCQGFLLFMAEYCSIVCVCHILFMYSSVHWHLGSFHLWQLWLVLQWTLAYSCLSLCFQFFAICT